MLYAILCYDSEETVSSWTKEEDTVVMKQLLDVQDGWAKAGKLGPVARLMPTKSAVTLRKTKSSFVVDGPFAETKEQLLGFFVVECASVDEATERARELAQASRSAGAYEIRPIGFFAPGVVK
ncbi:MAG TPA: YciI family protein [Polyangiaceae bacterium]|jgi:hypothetical protein|nr:YciI family protein [Polyangiaceae bacterium]